MNAGGIQLPEDGFHAADLSPAIAQAAQLLGRPADYTDEQGYDHRIVGATVAEDGRKVAWVESRSKQIREGFLDVEYRLWAWVDGRHAVDWEVATYNPFFGCDVGYMAWWDDRVLLVYREKHESRVASVPVKGDPALFRIDDAWTLAQDVICFGSAEPGLVEGVRLPQLSRTLPVPAVVLADLSEPVRLGVPSDVEAFQDAVRLHVFGEPAPPEADLILGAFAWRFWDPNPKGAVVGRWNSPGWLPFYWYQVLPEKAKPGYLSLLDRIAARELAKERTAVSLAADYVSLRCRQVAAACRAGALPEGTPCAFWVDWSQKGFKGELGLFPPGFRKAWETLRPHKARWTPF